MNIKKILASTLAVIAIFSVSVTTFATDVTHRNSNRTIVKVGYLDDYGIINTPIVQGSEGYGYEYLEKLEEYTDYDFEYIPLAWAEGMEQLKDGEIDLLAPASMSDERKEVYDYVDTVFSYEEVSIYALEDSDYTYGEPSQLNDKVLGTLEGSVYEERLQTYANKYDLDYTIKHTDHTTAIEDIKSGKIDLYVGSSLHLRDGVHSIDKVSREELYLMTRKGNDTLNEAINSAMLALEADDGYYNELLWYKYYDTVHKATKKLSANEITALQSKDVYTVGYHADLPPVSYTLPSGEPKGYSIEVMNLLASKLGIHIRYVPLYDDAGNNAENVDFNLSPIHDESATYGVLSEPYDTQNLLIVKNKDLIASDVQNILVPDYSTIHIEDFLQPYSAATIHKIYSSTDSQRIANTVNIDCKIIPESSELFIRDKSNVSISVLDVSVPIGIAVSNELPTEVLTALNKTIHSLKGSTVDEIVIKSVLALQTEPTFLDTLIQYQWQIIAIFLLIVGAFVSMLWKSRKTAKRLLEVDALTGTMTTYKFVQEASRILATAKPNEYMIILLDIDKFQTVNKVYGTEVGDKLLNILTKSIKSQAPNGSIVSRMQSDSFAILTKTSEVDHHKLYENFVEELKQIGIDIPVYFSIGVYLIEKPTDDISFMIDNARTAKGYGKTIFGNTVNYFTKELKSKHEKESYILSSMETALENGEFFIVVQPKVDLQTEKLVGGEVLIRWKQQDGTFVYPDEFIPLFEENRFIVKLDHYVLLKTCEFIRDSKLALPVISVNVSARTMLESDFMEIGHQILKHYGVNPQQLEVELTESVLDADFNRISNVISQLKKIGVAIAIDDFGKGASSLARIKELEVNVLKLDKEFIDNNTGNEKGKLVLNNILSMASDLGITSLAEGIETKEQQDLLINLGCEQGQGYYFDKPLLLEDFLQRVEANASKYAFQDIPANKKIKGYMTNFDHLPYAIVITQNDPYFTVLKANGLFYNIIGHTKSGFLQQHQNRLSEIFWGDNNLNISSQIHGEDMDMEFDFRVQTETGDIVWLHNHMHYDASRDLLFSSVVDITKRSFSGEIHLSFDAYKAHGESLKWLDQYTKEYILISDIETENVVYMNHRTMDYLCYHDEADWNGKKHYDIEFGSKNNIDEGYYLPVPEDRFVSREYYNQFHNMYLHVESRIITVLGRKMKLEIISDITAQKQVESEHSLQKTLHKCIEYLYTTTTDTSINNTATYELLLEQIMMHYHAERAYFYTFQTNTAEIDEHYEVVADGISSGKNELKSLPPTIREKLLYQLHEHNLLTKQDLAKFEPWEIERASAIYDIHGVDSFVYGAVKDTQGKVIGFMGVDNPREHKNNADLMLLLSRFVWLFVKNEETKKLQTSSEQLLQDSMVHEQELMKQDEMSRMNVLEICHKKLQGIRHEKTNILSVLTALRLHYGACAVTILEFSQDRKTYDVTYESLADNVPSIVAEYQNVPMESLNTVVDNVTDNMEFNIASKEICTLSKDLRDEWEPFGIAKIVSAPLHNRHNELFGMLCVSNITLNQHTQTLIYGVAKHIADYLITVHIHQESVLDPLTKLLNKKETELRISNHLECGTGGVMFIIDMDKFKNINDTLGHMIGDEMLVMAAQAIKDTFRNTDIQGRIGGDEFMVFCPEPITDELVKQKASTILSLCNQNYEHNDKTLEISCTIGIARVKSGDTFQNLYENADHALYHAKIQGKNQFNFSTK